MTPRHRSRDKMSIRNSGPREQPNFKPQITPAKTESLTATNPKAQSPIDGVEEETLLLKQAYEQCNDWEKLRGDGTQLLKDIEERNETIQFMRNTLDLMEFQRNRARSASPQKRIGFNVTRTPLGHVRNGLSNT